MAVKGSEYIWTEWQSLNDTEKQNIFNQVWDEFNPEIGQRTKKEIIDNFIDSLKIECQQYGIKTFGWNVYMLYVIVENSKIRVPKKFGGLSVNKGIISEKIDSKKALVKFGYGGKMEVDLTNRIIIG